MEDVNCDLLSEVMTEGIPNRGIQYLNMAPAHSVAVIDLMGIASGHLEVLSTMVKRYEKPLDSGNGPTKSTFM